MNGPPAAGEPLGLATLGEAIVDASIAGGIFALKIAAILVPALILYEVLAERPLFARWGRAIGSRLSRLGMSSASTVPLAAGIFLGIGHGAGILIAVAEDGRLTRSETGSLFLFLATCHAIIEDTLLFALVGAPGPGEALRRWAFLIGSRLLLAILVTAGLERLRTRTGEP
jgi:hypothetical protein